MRYLPAEELFSQTGQRDPAIEKCKGRIFKTIGDGLLAEFQSVTEAVCCAVEFQQNMARRNRDLPASRGLLYRIGINLGDVIVEDDDIFGDRVNVSVARPLRHRAAVGAERDLSLRRAEVARLKRKRPDSLNAYDLVLQSQSDVVSGMPARVTKALVLLEHALALEPDYALAHAFAAMRHHCLSFAPACVKKAGRPRSAMRRRPSSTTRTTRLL